jgi:hypothetical protein
MQVSCNLFLSMMTQELINYAWEDVCIGCSQLQNILCPDLFLNQDLGDYVKAKSTT